MRPKSSRLNWAFGTALLSAVLLCGLAWSLAATGAITRESGTQSPASTGQPPVALPSPSPVPLPANLSIPRYTPGVAPFHDGQVLVYKGSWEGIPAGEARIKIAHSKPDPALWIGEMWLWSSALVDPVYRMRDYFSEDFAYTSWQPIKINIFQNEKQRRDHWIATFDRPRALITTVKTNKAGHVTVRHFSGGDPWGPFSGAMMALSQPLTPGQSYTFDVFSGGNRYVFSFAVEGREQITTSLGAFNALRIAPAVIWLSDKSFRSQASYTTLYVSDDARHLPLRLESAVFIGSVVVDLTQVVDGDQPTSQ